MTSFVVVYFVFGIECLSNCFSISTSVGDPGIFRRVYKGCVISFYGRDTLVDLIELDMVYFDVILGMDWLHSYYTSLDYQTHRVMFKFPNELVIVWEAVL